MGCFSGRLMSAASYQKLFCKLCSPFCCSFDEFVEEPHPIPPPSWLLPSLYFIIIILIFWPPHHTACEILVSWPGMEPMSPALQCNLNYWTTREVSIAQNLYTLSCWQKIESSKVFGMCKNILDLFSEGHIMCFR